MFNIQSMNKSSIVLRQDAEVRSLPFLWLSDRGLTSAQQKQNPKFCSLYQVCSHHWINATRVLCLPRQLLYLFSFSHREKFFFLTLYEVLPSQMLICSFVRFWLMGFGWKICFPELNQGKTQTAAWLFPPLAEPKSAKAAPSCWLLRGALRRVCIGI